MQEVHDLKNEVSAMHNLLKQIHRLPKLVDIMKAGSLKNDLERELSYLSLEADAEDLAAAECLAGMNNEL